MANHPILKFRELVSLIERCGGHVISGKGSRYMCRARGKPSYPIHSHKLGAEVNTVYIRGLRKAWGLMPEHGTSDDDFYVGNWKV